MSTDEESDIPEDFFKDVTFYIVGDIAENVRDFCCCIGNMVGGVTLTETLSLCKNWLT